jgi:hydrogenase expression/formation protein HypC
MCLSIPARIDKIEGDTAICTVGKSSYKAGLNLLEKGSYKVGDYVLIHTGLAIQVLDKDEAESTLKTFEEFEQLNNELDNEEKESGKRIV